MKQTWYRAVLVAAVLAAGCGEGEKANLRESRRDDRMGGHISPKSMWRATGLGMVEPEAAIDGRMDTAAFGRAVPGSQLQIDLGKACSFNRVVVDHGSSNVDDYPRVLALKISMDGRNFETRKAVLGTRWRTNINIVAPTMARYIRLEVLPARDPGVGSWRVAEVTLH